MRKTLSELFEIENKKGNYINSDVSDYSVFKDKNLLDSLRNKIIQNIIDNDLSDSKYLEDYIKTLGRNKVVELIQEQIDSISGVDEDVFTDDEGVTYSSIVWKEETV